VTQRSVTAILHAHSNWSYDGSWPLARLARLFGRMGAEASMMTEHDTGFEATRFAEFVAECAAASTPRCRLVPGIEYSCPDNDVHILTWGVDRFLGAGRPVLETLRDVAEAGGVSIMAHPARHDAWRLFQPEWAPYLTAIEVWNRKADGLAPGREALALVRETGLPATAGLDFHRRKQIWPLANRLAVETALPLEQGLVKALRAGQVVPIAFGLPVLDADGRERQAFGAINRSAERLRRAARPLFRR
jgi:hypothetical protein